MTTIKKSILINAPKEKIWHVLLDDATYRQWTSVFHEGSYAEGGWDTGSKVHFKSPEGDGLVSKVLVHEPMQKISFEHIGILKKGAEVFIDDDSDSELKEWKGARETYILSERDGQAQLNIELDSTDKHLDYFDRTWDQALIKVKELSEN